MANITKDKAKGQLAEKKGSVTEFTNLPLDQIVLTPHNPRKINSADPAIAELAKSIKESGLLQPVICRPLTADKYELLAGARRYHACKSLKAKTIMAIVRDLDDKSAIEITVLENLQREDLSPLEEARGVNELLTSGHDVSVIADNLGKSKGWVYRRGKLVDLIPAMIKRIEDNNPDNPWKKATAAHLELIARLPKERQEKIAEDEYYPIDSNVKDFAHQLGREEMLLSTASWKMEDTTLGNPACSICQRRTDINPELFDDQWLSAKIRKQARCLVPECWQKKYDAFTKKKVDEMRKEHGDKIVIIDERGYQSRQYSSIKGSVSQYDVESVKKTDPNARPAIVITEGKIETKYVKLEEENEKPKAKQPSIDLKRKAWIINYVLDAVTKRKEAPFESIGIAGAFVANFGTSERESYVSGEPTWSNARKLGDQSCSDIMNAMWKIIVPILQQRLRYFTISQCVDQYKEAIEQANLLKIGSEEDLLALAVKALPGKGEAQK